MLRVTDVFEQIGAATRDDILKGYNATILAYGQTSSGKTHSMFGPGGGDVQALAAGHPMYARRGLIPRLFESLFAWVGGTDPEEVSVQITMSAFELYREVPPPPPPPTPTAVPRAAVPLVSARGTELR